MKKNIKRILLAVSMVVLASTLAYYVLWYRPIRQRTQCYMQMSIYNQQILSCGVDETCGEAWRNPEATEKLVERLFDRKFPHCPSGGTYSIVIRNRYGYSMPELTCSLENTHKHRYPRERILKRIKKKGNTEIHTYSLKW